MIINKKNNNQDIIQYDDDDKMKDQSMKDQSMKDQSENEVMDTADDDKKKEPSWFQCDVQNLRILKAITTLESGACTEPVHR